MAFIVLQGKRYLLGKYRGIVKDNNDPKKLGRLQISVPSIWGGSVNHHAWAEPSFPSTEVFTVPPIGSQVWIEFEEGDPDSPIWTGCFLTSTQPHDEAKTGSPKVRSIKTEQNLRVSLDDNVKEIQIKVSDNTIITLKQSGDKIIVDAEAIEIGAGASHPIAFGDNIMNIFNGHHHMVTGTTGPGGGDMHSHPVAINSQVPGSLIATSDLSAKHKVE